MCSPVSIMRRPRPSGLRGVRPALALGQARERAAREPAAQGRETLERPTRAPTSRDREALERAAREPVTREPATLERATEQGTRARAPPFLEPAARAAGRRL